MGKCNMDEFAMGSNNSHSFFGPVLHPRNPELSPGGSSGGSAVAVASGLADLALGSDTGGSVRLPAAYCDVIGFKGTYGAVSRHGLVPYAPSLDCIGILGNKISDIRRLFSVISRECTKDPKYKGVHYNYEEGYKSDNFRIGLLKGFPVRNAQVETIGELEIPFGKELLPMYYVTALSEAASSLARYVTSSPFSPTSNRSDLGDEARRRIILGTAIKSQSLPSYFHAQRLRAILREAMYYIFQRTDLLLLDMPNVVRAGEQHGEAEYEQDGVLGLANLTGLPAISIPVQPGKSVMLMAAWGKDYMLLDTAQKLLNRFKE